MSKRTDGEAPVCVIFRHVFLGPNVFLNTLFSSILIVRSYLRRKPNLTRM